MRSFSDIDKKYGYDGELGAMCGADGTTFRLWSPAAQSVELLLYKRADSRAPMLRKAMRRDGGVWSVRIDGDLCGIYYTYLVAFEGVPRETADPYAKTTALGRGMVIDMRRAEPKGWREDAPVLLRSPTDAVISELSVRDFSMDKGAGFASRGKFAALSEQGVTNSHGDAAGLDHLSALGVTHIQLLPVFDFDDCGGYNWGYNPVSWFSPAGAYSLRQSDGFSRVKELRKLVMALHSRGMGVVFDVVYNHLFSAEHSPQGAAFPRYYFRESTGGGYSNGSGCGNETASERKMAGRLILDSLCFIAKEYHADGFRFDLMGLLDIETLSRCEAKLRVINPSMLLYGEGWTGGESPLDESLRAVKRNAARLPGFGFFSDDFRDAVRGDVFNAAGQGYVSGAAESCRERVKSAMTGGISSGDAWATSPAQSVNYVECHDNLTLHDKLKSCMGSAGVADADRLAAALLFMSRGIPFIAAGQEMLRSKRVRGGFDENSYRSPDSVNAIKWDSVTTRRSLWEYYRGLIALRKELSELRGGDEPMSFADLEGGAFLMRCGRVCALFNPTERSVSAKIAGELSVMASGRRASSTPLFTVRGRLCAKPRSATIAAMKD